MNETRPAFAAIILMGFLLVAFSVVHAGLTPRPSMKFTRRR